MILADRHCLKNILSQHAKPKKGENNAKQYKRLWSRYLSWRTHVKRETETKKTNAT